MKMYEVFNEGAAPSAVKKLMSGHKYTCKDCGCEMHNCKPDCDCKHDSHDETGSWWKDENGNGIPDVMEESKDTHCSDKCCGADVKAEDCKCPPTCKHCNCNAVAETTTAGAIATSMGNGNGFANGGPGVVKRVKKLRNKASKR
jgi:hypothetical protein